MRLNEILDEKWVRAYRGVSSGEAPGALGTFFSSSRAVANSYAQGNVIEVELDLSAALTWTHETTARFQEYVISWRKEGRLPPNAQKALSYANKKNGSNTTMDRAIGAVLHEHPDRIGHLELDPLMGFVKAFAKEYSCDVVVRQHERSAGVYDGTTEYIVFSPRRIRPLRHEPTSAIAAAIDTRRRDTSPG